MAVVPGDSVVEVRDPIHGSIPLRPEEARVVDHPYVQRLRGIRQMGFSHLAFPGATHSRYAHSLGVMHVAGQFFDQAYARWTFTDPDARARFRAAVRLAALCHDLGHAPFSHATEFAMPPVADLGIDAYRRVAPRRATHEDFTIAVLEKTDLARVIAENAPCTARHVAALISTDVRVTDDFFRDGGFDHRRILSQIVSSEMDADRLDYLQRDSYYSGATYGGIDVRWILNHLSAHAADGAVWLALGSRALYAFEDFLIARHHMFLMVYFHHTSTVYEEMLKRWFEAGASWRIEPDLDAWLYVDDVALEAELRRDASPWARRIVTRVPYRRAVERHGAGPEVDLSAARERLVANGLDVIAVETVGQLSRYALKRRAAPSIFVVDQQPGGEGRVVPLSEATAIFGRYADERRISRLYVPPESVERARTILGARGP